MEYKFIRTLHGPAVMGDDEVVFFHEFGPLQDYVNEDPQFFDKAFEFCKEALADHGQTLAKAVTEPVVGLDHALSLMQYWNAAQSLRRFQQSVQHNHGYPEPSPIL